MAVLQQSSHIDQYAKPNCCLFMARRSAVRVQAIYRMLRERRRFLAARQAVCVLQAAYRAHVVRVAFAQVLRTHRAAVAIQRHVRGYLARKRCALCNHFPLYPTTTPWIEPLTSSAILWCSPACLSHV